MTHIIKVVLAEDGDALRRSLADSLREQPDIQVLGEATDGEELVALCRETPPDVAVVDIRMPGMDGVAACKILRSELPEVRLLILTTFDDDEYLRELFGLGVDGYLLKTGSPPRLAEAVRGVYNGLGAVDAGVSRKLGSLLNAPKKPGTGPLTETELRAARLIAEGKYNKEIAVELGITYGRTRNLVSAVYRKLGAVDREDLIARLEKE
ncbi:response regulator transcription factor [Hungatella hathewayi]|uniref:response regulator transcription factor n=1 Tax=Hungatella hathewayi TaxID=154046 RepID=UPI0003391D2A|nr:response regulator transcription factor [Hungatella hathewayi]CCZ63034.1 two component transcriptional regulator LuxR family [Hungatella hathewayi CAG:224]